MDRFHLFQEKLYQVNAENFNSIALDLFQIQAKGNPVYRRWIEILGIQPEKVASLLDIPFMPISFFKSQRIQTGHWDWKDEFTSSSTTGHSLSRHGIKDLVFYLNHAEKCFRSSFGPPAEYHILALLPSYLERQGSSLVAMLDHFIRISQSSYAGFFLNQTDKLLSQVDKLKGEGKKVMLWGVSFALLDLAEKHQPDLSHALVIETGGMKGRRKELTREELHGLLKSGLNVDRVFSEYGMTELYSQAYSKGSNCFYPPPWMKVIIRDVNDPFRKGLIHETGGINVIDLANFHSMAFLETEDLGRVYPDGSFEVLGRFDNSELRGCNLFMV